MGGKSKRVTIGYRYLLGMQQVYCHGPVDRLNEIRVDDRRAFSGTAKEGELLINKGNLFGGDEREGGVRGLLDVEFGGPEQQPNSYLVSKLGSLVPAFRGVTQLVLKQMEMGMNPYLKPWSATFQRIFTRQDGIEQWYLQKAPIRNFGEAAIYIAIDKSGSMDYGEALVEPGDPSRMDVAKEALADVFDELAPVAAEFPLDIMVVAWANSSESIVRRNVDSSNISEINNFVQGLVANGTSTNYEEAVNDAPAFFDGAGSKPRIVIFITDGVPTAGSVESAANTLFSVNGVRSYGINILLEDTSSTALMDNTPEDGVPVVSIEDSSKLRDAIINSLFSHIDLNPAHIIRECDTDPDWGMGYPESDIDDTTFTAAADQLYDEGMGISLLWDRQTPLEDFVDDIARHIDAVHDIDRRTGKFRLRLIRDDYVVDDLLVLGPSQIDRVENYGRAAPGDVINQVTVRYWDATTRDTQSVTVEDTALISRDGGIINQTVDYPGFTRSDLALRVAARDLKAGSIPLLGATLYCDNTANELSVGDPFVFEWPDLHDPGIVMRVTEIAFGDGVNNQIRIQCAEDVFATSDEAAAKATETAWEDPVSEPAVAQNRLAFEAPYYELVQDRGQSDVDDRLAENAEIGVVMAAAVRPADDSINAAMHTDSGAGYEEIAVLDFCPTATLAAAVGPVDTAWTIGNGVDLDLVELGTHCQISDELCSVTAIDEDAGTMTVGRAVLDTVPDPDGYAAGERIYFWDGFGAADPGEYATAEQIEVKLLPTTGIGQLAIADAPANQVTIQQRAYLPYPPGNLKVNTEYFPKTIGGNAALALTWAHRDRVQQTAGELVPFTDEDVGPESGQTYTLRLYGEDDTLGRTESSITATSYSYATEAELEDFGLSEAGDKPWTPSQLETLLWLAADDADTITLNSGVEAWADKSGLSISADQSTAGDRPAYATSAINGKPAVRFDGSSDHLVISGNAPFPTGAGGYIIFSVIAASSDTTRAIYFAGAESTNEGFLYRVLSSYRINDGWWSNNLITGNNVIVQDQPHLVAISFDGSGREIWVDGESLATDSETAKNTAVGDNIIGAALSSGSPTQFFDGDIGEIVLVSAVTPEERQLVEGYLAHKWGFQSSLPSGHPYKAAPPTFSFRLNGRLRFELESVRDGVASWQKHNVEVRRPGWNFNWDMYWDGGAP